MDDQYVVRSTRLAVVPGDPRSGARYEQVVPGLDGRACERVVRNVAPGTQVRVTG